MTVDAAQFRKSLQHAVEAAGGEVPESEVSRGPLHDLESGINFSIRQLDRVKSNYHAALEFWEGEYKDEKDILFLQFNRTRNDGEGDAGCGGRYISYDPESDTFSVAPSQGRIDGDIPDEFQKEVDLSFDQALALLNTNLVSHYRLSDEALDKVRADIV